MKLSSLKIFALKLALFSSALAYLAIDLFLWHGPVWGLMYAHSERAEDRSPAVAQVYGERISEAQLARYTAEQNLLSGRVAASPAQRTALLMDMVRSAILRIRSRYNDKNLPDFATAAQEEVQRLASRAKSDEDFEHWLASQCLTREDFTKKIEAGLKARAQLERAVQPFCEVSDADVAKHYELLKDGLTLPARRKLKHIFLATLDKNPEKVREKAQDILDKIQAGTYQFERAALEFSEDDHSYAHGGELGEISDDENFALPELPLFGAGAIPAGQLTLAQSRWGWHILLAGELMPARAITLDEARESLRSAIQSAQYELSVQAYFEEALREGFQKKRLQIHVP